MTEESQPRKSRRKAITISVAIVAVIAIAVITALKCHAQAAADQQLMYDHGYAYPSQIGLDLSPLGRCRYFQVRQDGTRPTQVPRFHRRHRHASHSSHDDETDRASYTNPIRNRSIRPNTPPQSSNYSTSSSATCTPSHASRPVCHCRSERCRRWRRPSSYINAKATGD